MNDFGRNYPADNHWGNLKKKDETGKDKEYSLHVQAPGIEITGLDKSITEMCATMSAVLEDGASDVFLGDMYEAGQAVQQRQKATKNNRTMLYEKIQAQANDGDNMKLIPENRIFDDHGELKFALAPMATAIIQTSSGEVTMIVGWRGSCTAVDWLQDFAEAPIISKTWNKYAPDLRVHAGMAGLVENDMTTHGDTILKHIKDNNVTQVVFTGHSLGGGMAYVAHLYALATWGEDLPKVTFRALTFEAPMAFYLPDEAERPEKLNLVLKTLEELSRNCVFCGDVVPRFPGNSTYIKEVFSKFVPLYQSINAIVEKVAGKTDDLLHAKINDLVNNLGKFDHCSKIIYYENPEGEPELLSAIDFKNKTLAAALTANNTKFNTKIENLEANILKMTPFRFGPAGSRWEGDGDFENIFAFLNDAHGVLPYAMSPSYFPSESPGSSLKYTAKGEPIAEYIKKHEK